MKIEITEGQWKYLTVLLETVLVEITRNGKHNIDLNYVSDIARLYHQLKECGRNGS